MTSIYFVIELGVGLHLESLTLQADAFHMLSDMIAMSIGIYAYKSSLKPPNPKATFGYSRWKVVGGFANSVILISLGFHVFLEAVNRFFEPNKDLVDDSFILLVVSGIGLLINLIGLFLLHGHDEEDHNHHAVLLHVLGDAFGSLASLGSAMVMGWWKEWETRYLVDPILSLVVVCLILLTTIPTLKVTLHILLQKVPNNVEALQLERELLSLDEVQSLHHLHLWQLDNKKKVASVHVVPLERRRPALDPIKHIFHNHGFHSTTVQFDSPEKRCEPLCGEKNCIESRCCIEVFGEESETKTLE